MQLCACRSTGSNAQSGSNTSVETASSAAQSQVLSPDGTAAQFRSQDRLDEHYQKHVVQQKEFGNITEDEYLALAQQLVGNPGSSVLTKKDSDGNTLFYDPDTNEFAVLSDDGYIRTFFKPSGGQSYYDKQQ